ncbi:MAG: low molecular weight protein-tyrosine-phosphatase [Eubacterium sp.]|nr:low molecular weight protein-tyrosine-phosphatase [Eubacterium sp.]
MSDYLKSDHVISILFCCHGNICRSAMAEAMFRQMIKGAHAEEHFSCDSAATSREEIGNGMYAPAVRKLKAEGVPIGNHRARQMTVSDYNCYDLLIGMDDENIRNMTRICHGDPDKKIRKLLSFAGEERSIADPWYTGNFDATYRDLTIGLKALTEDIGLDVHEEKSRQKQL